MVQIFGGYLKVKFVLLIVLFAVNSQAGVWPTQNQWDMSWENKFTEWVQTNWTDDVFVNKKSPYYGIKTDCADATYTMRILFSYENNLAFAIRDVTDYSSRVAISNEMTRWDGSEDEKSKLFLFIDYINKITATVTLPNDLYPVSVTRESFRPGLVYVEPKIHSYQLIELPRSGVPVLLSSTVPVKLRKLNLLHDFSPYAPEDDRLYRDGYQRFRWPKYLYQSKHKIPGFSVEQFNLSRDVEYEHAEFVELLFERLALMPESLQEKTQRLFDNLCRYSQGRVTVVQEALDYKREISNRCMNSSEYDSYSTPSRDKKLEEQFERFDTFAQEKLLIGNESDDDEGDSWGDEKEIKLTEKIHLAQLLFKDNDISTPEYEKLTTGCPISYRSTSTISLRELWSRLRNGNMVTNPNAPLSYRWGEEGDEYQSSCREY